MCRGTLGGPKFLKIVFKGLNRKEKVENSRTFALTAVPWRRRSNPFSNGMAHGGFADSRTLLSGRGRPLADASQKTFEMRVGN